MSKKKDERNSLTIVELSQEATDILNLLAMKERSKNGIRKFGRKNLIEQILEDYTTKI